MPPDLPENVFDFALHAQTATAGYRMVRPDYELFTYLTKRLLGDMFVVADIRPHSIEARAKSLDSFEKKASKALESDPTRPKYSDPLREINDLAGVRVITFLSRTVEEVCAVIEREFVVREKTDKSAELLDEGKLGYHSIHFLVQLNATRSRLPEYQRYRDLIVEIQVRTLLQHAWAEMEHDIQYKSAAVIPAVIRKKFIALAGLLEIADREFQSLQDEDERLRREARDSVQAGNFSVVEITPDALRSYLDRRFGADGRMKSWGYEWSAGMLREIGFQTLDELDACLSGYDDDQVSRAAWWGGRQGQLSRFEDVVFASMGETFMERHPWGRDSDWVSRMSARLNRLKDGGIKIGTFVPKHDNERPSS